MVYTVQQHPSLCLSLFVSSLLLPRTHLSAGEDTPPISVTLSSRDACKGHCVIPICARVRARALCNSYVPTSFRVSAPFVVCAPQPPPRLPRSAVQPRHIVISLWSLVKLRVFVMRPGFFAVGGGEGVFVMRPGFFAVDVGERWNVRVAE